MSAQILLLDRVEFLTVKIETNNGEFSRDKNFPQLALDSDRLEILTRSDLFYPPDQVEDPRVFVLVYGLKVTKQDGEQDGFVPPYEVEVEVAGYFRYVGGEEFTGADRFRAVRFSGYQILYGAIREMVSNLTARGRHGLWHLPARNFGAVARKRAEEDEVKRLETLAESRKDAQAAPKHRPKRRAEKKTAAS